MRGKKKVFKNLGQLKTYLQNVDNFDQFYIIQQGGRGVTREQVIVQLEKAIAKDAESVYQANPILWNKLKVRDGNMLEALARDQKLSTNNEYEIFRNSIKITKE